MIVQIQNPWIEIVAFYIVDPRLMSVCAYPKSFARNIVAAEIVATQIVAPRTVSGCHIHKPWLEIVVSEIVVSEIVSLGVVVQV